MIEKKCVVCDKTFLLEKATSSFGRYIAGKRPVNTKTCSNDCSYRLKINIGREKNEKNKTIEVTRKCKWCGKEVISNKYSVNNFCKDNDSLCYRSYLSKSKMGKKNPAYTKGLAVTGKRKYTGIHLRACSKYRKDFLKRNDFLYCEVCGVNENGAKKFEVHHIYYASLYPKHVNLHNSKNLILLCIGCHNDFHSGKMRNENFLKLEEERGLKELFK